MYHGKYNNLQWWHPFSLTDKTYLLTLFRHVTRHRVCLICHLFYFRQSINDLSANHLHVKSSSSHATHRLTSVTKDNEVKKDLIKHNLIEEETTEIGKVHFRKYMNEIQIAVSVDEGKDVTT